MGRTVGRFLVTIGVIAVGVGIVQGAGTADAAAHTVYQIPATAVTMSGSGIPGPYFAAVTAAPTSTPGTTAFSAPASPYVCSSSAGRALVRISYINITGLRSGTATVKPCAGFVDPTPVVATADTGVGRVVAQIEVIGSQAYPDAGQPSLPGFATFAAY
ncbi:hypothetical protein [Gordonia rhizosphera]|nr:hypothetical protein [Gordonia rhizosphera]